MGYYTYTDVPNVQWKQRVKKDYETLKGYEYGILGTLVGCNEDVPSSIHPCVDTFTIHDVCIR